MTSSPCHVVLLTPPGRGAVATVLVAGERATAIVDRHFHAAAEKPLADFPLGRIVFGRWQSPSNTVLGTQHSVLSTQYSVPGGEELVVCRTAINRIEIHCHGGSAASHAIIAALEADGCRLMQWRDWIAATASDPIAAAARVLLADAPTMRTAAILLEQMGGRLRGEIEDIVALFETGQTAVACQRLHVLWQRSSLGLHLTQPFRVVLAGRPNVGKSSLLNAMLGYSRAIVFDDPGTTRDVLQATTAFDGWPVELSDTAGLRAAGDAIEAEGVARARRAAAAADLLVLVFDATQPWTANDQMLVDEYPESLVVMNKCDLSGVGLATCPAVRTSATTGAGIDELIRNIGERLVPSPPQSGEAVPFTPEHCDAIALAHSSAVLHEFAAAAQHLRGLVG